MLCRIPAGANLEDGKQGGTILASHVPFCGTKDAGRGLWIRLKDSCRASGSSSNQLLPTLFTLRNDDSEIIAVMSSNVDDVLYSYLTKGAEVVNSVSASAILGRQGRLWHFHILRRGISPGRKLWNLCFDKGQYRTCATCCVRCQTGIDKKANGGRKTPIEVFYTITRLDRETNTTRSVLSPLTNPKHIRRRSTHNGAKEDGWRFSHADIAGLNKQCGGSTPGPQEG